MAVKITADSTCDLSGSLVKENGIIITPLYVNYEGNSYRDGVDIKPSDIFDYVAKTKKLPKTSAGTIGDYTEAFSKILAKGDSVVHISIGSKFSASYQNALAAASELDGDVYVVDSKNLSTGSGFVVLKAAALAREGKSATKIAEELKEFTPKVRASFCIDTLTFLHKGGRCSAVAVLGSNLLKIKPCIEVVDGKMDVGKKYRGHLNTVLLQYVKDLFENADNIDTSSVFITHTGCDANLVQSVKDEIAKFIKFDNVIETIAGCTISNHCGPGTLGVLFVTK